MTAQFRPVPTMVSRKLQALAFIHRYIAEWVKSPSYGEIAAALDVSRERAKELVRQLKREGLIVRESGAHRGISLPPGDEAPGTAPNAAPSAAEAVRVLRAEGWVVDPRARALGPLSDPITNPPLPRLPDLDHIPALEVLGGFGIGSGGDEDGAGDGRRGGTADEGGGGEGDARDRRARGEARRRRTQGGGGAA